MNVNDDATRAAQVRHRVNQYFANTPKASNRMAGAAIVATMAPGILDIGDLNKFSLEDQGSGVISIASLGIGGYLGHKLATVPPEKRQEFERAAMSKIKDQAKVIQKDHGYEAANAYAAKEKQAFLDSINPISPRVADAVESLRANKTYVNPSVELFTRTPRQITGASRGALLGSLAGVVPAYFAIKADEVPEV